MFLISFAFSLARFWDDNSSSVTQKYRIATTANDNETYQRRAIDFTSNSPNMTTMTCQRNRIVSPAGIVSIRRYILLRSGIFSRRRQEDARRLKKTRPASRATVRQRMKETVQDRLGAGDVRVKARYWFSVIFSGLRHLTAFRHYQEPISMSRLFIPDSRARRARGAYLFVEESTGRMLPGYRAKAVASYSVKFISSIEEWGGGGTFNL